MSFSFNRKYFTAAILLFLVEVFIAVYINDSFVRPYAGDFLVVFFLYCLVKSFSKIPVKNAIFGVLLFAFIIEGLQFFKLVNMLGLQDNKIALAVLGNHFEWLDILIYTLAAFSIYLMEKTRQRSRSEMSY